MKIKTLDFFKIPEGIRIPYFGGLLYRIITKKQRKAIVIIPSINVGRPVTRIFSTLTL